MMTLMSERAMCSDEYGWIARGIGVGQVLKQILSLHFIDLHRRAKSFKRHTPEDWIWTRLVEPGKTITESW